LGVIVLADAEVLVGGVDVFDAEIDVGVAVGVESDEGKDVEEARDVAINGVGGADAECAPDICATTTAAPIGTESAAAVDAGCVEWSASGTLFSGRVALA
jgi:hypothetical protein